MATQEERRGQFGAVKQEASVIFSAKEKKYESSLAINGIVGVIDKVGNSIKDSLSIKPISITLVKQDKLRETLINLGNICYLAVAKMSEDESAFNTVQAAGAELFAKKNQDYGDAFAEYGVIGVLMRMGDKIKRSVSITKSGITLVEEEKLSETLMDLANYSYMAIILLDEGKSDTTASKNE